MECDGGVHKVFAEPCSKRAMSESYYRKPVFSFGTFISIVIVIVFSFSVVRLVTFLKF